MTTETAVRDHTYDGIEEFDNHLPNWWLWTFYIAIIFSAFYWWFFHTLDKGSMPLAAYDIAVKAEEESMQQWLQDNPVSDEVLLEMAADASTVAKGKELFMKPSLCVSCHDVGGRGRIGPNLTDEYWIYGNEPMTIYETLMKGRPGGMPEHASKLGPIGVREVTAYVLSIKNTNVEGGKEPESNAKKM